MRICYARELADIDLGFERLTDYFAGRSPRTHVLPSTPTPAVRRRSALRALGIRALHGLSRLAIARGRPRIVAIAGGRGKTVLKRTLAELLAMQLRVRCNPLSYNTEVGVAFAVLDMSFDRRRLWSVARGMSRAVGHALFPAPTDVLVLELGARRPADMEGLLRVVRPDIAVITALAPSYSEDQATLAAARAEMKVLIDAMRKHGGVLAICADDASLAELATAPLTYRFSKQDLVLQDSGARLRVNGQEYVLGRELVGDSSLYALSASILVARQLGIDEATIRRFMRGGSAEAAPRGDTGRLMNGASPLAGTCGRRPFYGPFPVEPLEAAKVRQAAS